MSEPKTLDKTVSRFRELPPEARSRLVAELRAADPAIDVAELATRVSNATAIERQIVTDLLEMLSPLVPMAVADAAFRSSISEFLAHRALAKGEKVGPAVQELAESIGQLLLCERSIGLSGKAQRVLWGHGRLYRGADTITQIRPLFMTDLDEQSKHAVVVHELRIDYRDQDFDSRFYVTMDRAQMSGLVKVLDRALKKEESLHAYGAFQYLKPTEA